MDDRAPELTGWLTSQLAHRLGAVVVAPAYRQAPEAVFPAALEDADALRWLAEHRTEVGAPPGPSHSSATARAATSRPPARRVPGTADSSSTLRCSSTPALELEDEFPSEREHASGPVLSAVAYRRVVDLYLAGGSPAAADASPLRAASFGGLPPTSS